MKQMLSQVSSDEGLQAQMNSVIGALQELKLLQVQTALEELEFSSKTSQASSYTQNCHIPRVHEPRRVYGGSLSTSSSFSSQEDTTDNNFSSYDIDDSTDWTASLMNHSRNRQPLVLGDNVFADLVGNWLDLPDVGGQTAGEEQVKESSSSSHSQDLSRKLSLTASIFKRVLRRVRPQHHQESEGMDVCKQPKITCRKPKSDVSKPFWVRTRGMKKKTTPSQQEGVAYQGSEGLIGWVEIVEKRPSVFDYSSAVWV
uniref:Inka box actin regulator 2 n=1 Tax=Sinocyclocheilus grahami TaxID=75366 RepID=A0A672S782_SINGR